MATSPVKAMLNDLDTVAAQVAAADGVDRSVLQNARALKLMSDKVTELATVIVAAGGVGDFEYVSNTLNEWSQVLAPQATVTWDREQVALKFKALDAMAAIDGLMSDDEKKTLTTLHETFKAAGKSTGVQSTRAPAPTIEGKAEHVKITFGETQLTSQAANKAMSVQNLKSGALKKLNEMLGTDGPVAENVAKDIHEAIKTVVNNEADTVVIHGVTVTSN